MQFYLNPQIMQKESIMNPKAYSVLFNITVIQYSLSTVIDCNVASSHFIYLCYHAKQQSPGKHGILKLSLHLVELAVCLCGMSLSVCSEQWCLQTACVSSF